MGSASLFAQAGSGITSGNSLFAGIAVAGILGFAYILYRRCVPLIQAQIDLRFDRPLSRVWQVLQFWLGQWKQPRYLLAGILHILIFAGFLVLAARSLSLVLMGFGILPPRELFGGVGDAYSVIKDYASTIVFITVVIAAARRIAFKPARYAAAPGDHRNHSVEALIVLGLIAVLMLSESIFSASDVTIHGTPGSPTEVLPQLSLAWVVQRFLLGVSVDQLDSLHFASYLIHDVTFFLFLCFLPFGKHFHVVTSLFNVFFARLDCGTVKPVRWGVSDEHLDQVKSIGVKTFGDFTWKHILDFYSCADCGRCSDNCPANAVGRPLSPRFLTLKARDYVFQHYPILGSQGNGTRLVPETYSEDEVWSCTTCGACEQECPLLVEYIDKIVDLRRGLVDDGNVPPSLQKPLKALESRGNPYGKLEKRRADWTKADGFQKDCMVRVLDKFNRAECLYFVDSITSYDDRIQGIGRATARILAELGEEFGILGAAERDSGHEVRRFGEEMLFISLRESNLRSIAASGIRRIVTSDPHAYNALKHDYDGIPPVEHVSQLLARSVKENKLTLKPLEDSGDVYAYHDPCYLGRHNHIYDDPRTVLDAIPRLARVEMKRCRDRSFCCGGGGLMLFYESKENERMGVRRVKMAADAGANVIVTACPFCMVNLEDAIKVSGMEDKMSVIDLTELVARQLVTHPEPLVKKLEASPLM